MFSRFPEVFPPDLFCLSVRLALAFALHPLLVALLRRRFLLTSLQSSPELLEVASQRSLLLQKKPFLVVLMDEKRGLKYREEQEEHVRTSEHYN